MAESETIDAATDAAMAEFGLRPEPSIVPNRLMPPAFLTHRGEVAKPYSPTLQDRFGKALRDLGLSRSTVNGLVGSTGLGREGPMAGSSLSDFSPLGLLWAGEEFVRTGDTLAAIGMLPGGAPAKAAVREGAETVARVANPIRVYHGSPHDWAAERLVRLADGRTEYIVGAPDKLPDVPEGAEVLKDFPFGRPRIADKMGTGEGAQAYGHGLYFAEAEDVARSYRDKLAKPGGSSIYEVAIHARPDDFLDLETPLTEQRAIEPALRRYFGRRYERAMTGPYRADGFTFKDLATDPVHAAMNVREMTEAGIPGIKYRDAMSRGDSATEGSRNYVIFPGNEHLIEVLRKYGIIGLLGTGAAASLADGGTGQAQAATMPAYQTGGGF